MNAIAEPPVQLRDPIAQYARDVCGGAIAMGHPLGATGGMILGTVLDELEQKALVGSPTLALAAEIAQMHLKLPASTKKGAECVFARQKTLRPLFSRLS